jgi:hypothetical protein
METNPLGEHKPNDKYRNMQLTNLIKRKEIECELLNKDNLKLHQRIQGRKPIISFQSLQNQYRQNRLYKEKVDRFKVAGDTMVFNEYLVNREGRYRLPNSTFTQMTDLKPIIKFDKDKSMEATFANTYKSPREINKSSTRNSKRNSVTISKEKFPFKMMKSSSDDRAFFKVKNVGAPKENISSQGLRFQKSKGLSSKGSEQSIKRPHMKQAM